MYGTCVGRIGDRSSLVLNNVPQDLSPSCDLTDPERFGASCCNDVRLVCLRLSYRTSCDIWVCEREANQRAFRNHRPIWFGNPV